MKRLAIITLTSLIVAVTGGGQGIAESSKSIKFSGTHYYGHTPKVFRLDPNQMIIQFETLGLRVNDNGEGPFHDASVHIVGVLYRGQGGSRLRAFETWTDKDGDKLIWELVEKTSQEPQPGTSPGSAEVFSGTGKYAGMQGTMDWLLRYPKPFPEGTGRGICRETVTLIPTP
jgi:hypothetical protein